MRSYLAHLGFILLMLVFGGTVLSDSGVRATEDKPLHIVLSGKSSPVVFPAVVIRADLSGTIEVLRPHSTSLSSALVMTGLEFNPSGQELEALKKNNFPKMATIYRQMVLTGHDTPAARLGLATALWLKGDLDDSLRAFSWAKTIDPKSPSVHMGMGLVMMDLGANDQAEQEMSPLLSIPKLHAAALNNLGSISRANSNYTQASEQFSEALANSPHLASAQYNLATTQMDLQNFKQAAHDYRKLSENLPEFTASYLNEGLAHLRANDPILAAAALNRARELDPHNPAIALALGLTDQNLGLDTQAAHLLSEALEHNPDDQRIHHLLANSLLRSGQVNRAAKILEQAFALAPRGAEEHFQQGLKMFLCDRPGIAAEHFLKALSKGKKDADLFFALGQSLLQADKVDAAIDSLSVASRMNPDSPDIHFALGLALRTGDRNAQAIREMKTATALKPSDVDMQVLLMDTLRETKRYKRCYQVGTELVQMHPELVASRFDLAFCLAMDGKLQLSSATLDKALEMDTDGTEIKAIWKRLRKKVKANINNPGAYLLWAKIQDKRGNWDQAIQSYEKFILSKPPRAWVVKAMKKIHYLSPGSAEFVSR